MFAELDTYDWQEAFKYARVAVEPVIGDEVHATPFDREDVRAIFVRLEGENDESDWVGIFRLEDGRVAALAAWCDSTGWG
jgi:hypothetical protein